MPNLSPEGWSGIFTAVSAAMLFFMDRRWTRQAGLRDVSGGEIARLRAALEKSDADVVLWRDRYYELREKRVDELEAHLKQDHPEAKKP